MPHPYKDIAIRASDAALKALIPAFEDAQSRDDEGDTVNDIVTMMAAVAASLIASAVWSLTSDHQSREEVASAMAATMVKYLRRTLEDKTAPSQKSGSIIDGAFHPAAAKPESLQ